MSDIYIPELIELDSYWQKAVEDAIYDTLKGEKRLYYALRNRKKINEKLEKLGLKPVYSQMSFSGRCHFSSQSFESLRGDNNSERCKSTSNTEWDSLDSATTLGSEQNEGTSWRGGATAKSNRLSLTPMRSKSKSKERKETPPEKILRNPERPILGNASLEKMKKSQNSFYCEPMGTEGKVSPSLENLSSDRQKDLKEEVHAAAARDDKSKRVEWLHVRKSNAFKDSDTEPSNHEMNDAPDVNKNRSVRKALDQKSRKSRGKTPSAKTVKIPMVLDPREDLFWEKEVKNAIRKNADHERKLYFALAKREIVNRNRGKTNGDTDDQQIQINESEAKMAAKKRRGKKVLSPYVKFYLEVYRELHDKVPIKRIAAETSKKWWHKSLRQRPKIQRPATPSRHRM